MTIIVDVLVLKGCFPSGVTITFDVLETANRVRASAGRPPAFAVRAIGSGARQARAFLRGSVNIEGEAGIIVVPGLGLGREQELLERLKCPDVRSAVRMIAAGHARNVAIAAACTGVFLLAEAGVLENRVATTTWWLAPLFRRLYPAVQLDDEALVTDDKRITTAGASMAQLDLMLAIVARYASRPLADTCAKYLLLDQRRSQARYMAISYLAASDKQVARAERWARDRLAGSFGIVEMAAAAALSPRTFARRVEKVTGLSPVKFLQRLRVERALELIETTRLPFEDIARQVGYSEGSTLRGIMKKHVGGSVRKLRSA